LARLSSSQRFGTWSSRRDMGRVLLKGNEDPGNSSILWS